MADWVFANVHIYKEERYTDKIIKSITKSGRHLPAKHSMVTKKDLSISTTLGLNILFLRFGHMWGFIVEYWTFIHAYMFIQISFIYILKFIQHIKRLDYILKY